MSYLSLYFLLKTGLYYTHYIGFHWLWNLLLALVAIWPQSTDPNRRSARLLRTLIWPAALVLLYHDSLLPTPSRVLSQLKAINGFSPAYVLELLGRLFNPTVLIALICIIVVYRLLAQRLRFATFALAAIFSVPLVNAYKAEHVQPTTPLQAAAPPGSAVPLAPSQIDVSISPQNQLQAFYAQQAQRRLSFSNAGAQPPFDVIILHICSLSWDDLDFVNARNNPLLKRFDILFTHFNSAASYSGPASIRLLRGNCGQTPHEKLYKSADPQCYLFPSLENLGYKSKYLMNHDGIYDDFAKSLLLYGGLKGQFESNRNAPVQMQNFDGSPIYEDFGVLSRWWSEQQSHSTQPVALYYNSISLHDGNRMSGQASQSSLDTYRPRLIKLLADLDKFITQLESTGKPVVVMLIPEHGASLRGDKVQISGMREIPGPRITLVPAAIKLVGLTRPTTAAPVLVSNQPISFFGLYALLGDLLADSPYLPGARSLKTRLEKVEETPFVSENDDVIVMRNATNGYVIKSGDGIWLPYQVD